MGARPSPVADTPLLTRLAASRRSMKITGQGYAVPMPLEDIPCGCLVYLAIWAVIAWVLQDSITGMLGISTKKRRAVLRGVGRRANLGALFSCPAPAPLSSAPSWEINKSFVSGPIGYKSIPGGVPSSPGISLPPGLFLALQTREVSV
jgi:hypothetical protein